ncbi:GpE family phage tail protein [Acinetobacter seifertii]|uniref:GpE family phage tail protein n=1 Tax=Acinetobacter seifertii TaxID=1530123 RepID=A0A7H2VCF5_9GAMM|nr:GpE family phage tail protein [Acinetobacter seifertii]
MNDVTDAIANIATVFHWPLSDFKDMSYSDLMMWHQKAYERNQPQE